MPSVLPVQAMRRGRSTCSIVELIVPGPAFQRNVEPGATGPSSADDLTSGFHDGQSSIAVSTPHTVSSGAPTSSLAVAETGASFAIDGLADRAVIVSPAFRSD